MSFCTDKTFFLLFFPKTFDAEKYYFSDKSDQTIINCWRQDSQLFSGQFIHIFCKIKRSFSPFISSLQAPLTTDGRQNDPKVSKDGE